MASMVAFGEVSASGWGRVVLRSLETCQCLLLMSAAAAYLNSAALESQCAY